MAQANVPGDRGIGDLGQTIRSAREAAGLSQLELARRAGVDRGYLSRIERGERVPSARFRDHLARVLGELEGVSA